ncbi:acyl carrier protein [Buchnera aphidicola]|uniref:Acyl carrier protein n=1 Tax=Buchnera aphidicola (Cinara cf. splendens/pseudotsugae 3390) TaxID=2518980 RepID=A0A451CXT9_9GAMM|nr:acyl carrier protein [Buchnera aphidicola]VFP77805.1 Acyl carrier protein [Buchnera aphidicola (Cinara cf. splendens/pseudotsugae 3390)]
MKNIFSRIEKILAKQFQIDNKDISLSSNLKKDLKADSLDFIELIMLLEEEFNIELFDMNPEKIQSIQNLVTYISNKLKKKNKIHKHE